MCSSVGWFVKAREFTAQRPEAQARRAADLVVAGKYIVVSIECPACSGSRYHLGFFRTSA
jgi:hypothetical protein